MPARHEQQDLALPDAPIEPRPSARAACAGRRRRASPALTRPTPGSQGRGRRSGADEASSRDDRPSRCSASWRRRRGAFALPHAAFTTARSVAIARPACTRSAARHEPPACSARVAGPRALWPNRGSLPSRSRAARLATSSRKGAKKMSRTGMGTEARHRSRDRPGDSTQIPPVARCRPGPPRRDGGAPVPRTRREARAAADHPRLRAAGPGDAAVVARARLRRAARGVNAAPAVGCCADSVEHLSSGEASAASDSLAALVGFLSASTGVASASWSPSSSSWRRRGRSIRRARRRTISRLQDEDDEGHGEVRAAKRRPADGRFRGCELRREGRSAISWCPSPPAGSAVTDAATHLRAYKIKAVKGSAEARQTPPDDGHEPSRHATGGYGEARSPARPDRAGSDGRAAASRTREPQCGSLYVLSRADLEGAAKLPKCDGHRHRSVHAGDACSPSRAASISVCRSTRSSRASRTAPATSPATPWRP